jgi:4-phosphopantoate--beta-alanine ligase
MTREKITAGVARGVTSPHGLIAHGRGEAFDYLLGEISHTFAMAATHMAGSLLAASRHPVISVNGNACALSAPELVELAKVSGARLEVNIFHTSPERELAIRDMLMEAGATDVLLPSRTHALSHIESNRRWVHPDGIFAADTVFVPLEDGDRCEALVRNGKRVITVDLNPLSRTARTATVTIVDNLVRCLPEITAAVRATELLKKAGIDGTRTPAEVLRGWDNRDILRQAERALRGWIP